MHHRIQIAHYYECRYIPCFINLLFIGFNNANVHGILVFFLFYFFVERLFDVLDCESFFFFVVVVVLVLVYSLALPVNPSQEPSLVCHTLDVTYRIHIYLCICIQYIDGVHAHRAYPANWPVVKPNRMYRVL